MYQFIVLGLGFLLLFGGAYLIKQSDKEGGVLGQAFSTSKNIQTSDIDLTTEAMVGSFMCDGKSGCINPYTLTLAEAGDVYFNHTSGTSTILEHGLWNIEKGGLITLTLTNTPDENYETPRVILVQSVNRNKLSNFVYDNNTYMDMNKPVFIRQAE